MQPELLQKNRRSIRLQDYDYTQPGLYFITICTYERECIFGSIINEEMTLTDAGQIALDTWNEIPQHFQNVETDAFIIMPNHIHGIIAILDNPVRATHASPSEHASPHPSGPKPRSIGAIIGSYKSAVSKRIHSLDAIHDDFVRATHASPIEHASPPKQSSPIWHRNYYEHIIRSEPDLDRIREYIESNPANWTLDTENPAGAK
ncbi:MAG: transposase [Chloroflexi bacterium HGW-Chloroflexi-10]|nr:MAG: transposase [Chloroflexi bacterium HGW-Chloroflexi-10]